MVQRIQPNKHKEQYSEDQDYIDKSEPIASQLDDIISMKPARVVRWGSAVICLVVAVLALELSFISFPDYIEGSAAVTTSPLPLPIRTKQSGKLIQLFVAEGDAVKRDQWIAEWENTTGHEQILRLGAFCDSVLIATANDDVERLRVLSTKSFANLGDAQTIFNTVIQSIENYTRLNAGQIQDRRQTLIQNQLDELHLLADSKTNSVGILRKHLKEAKEEYAAYQKLFKQKVISRQELTAAAKKFRDVQIAFEDQKQSDLQNRIAVAEQQKQLLELTHSDDEKEQTQSSSITAQVRSLQSFISDWKFRYLIVAPTEGNIHFSGDVQSNASLPAEQEFAVVVPERAKIIAEIAVPSEGAGKIRQNQEVQVYLDQYPRSEFGYIKGQVQSVSMLPTTQGSETLYRVIVPLPEKLITSYHTPIRFSGIMKGRAKIILDERSVWERVWGAVRDVR